MLVHSAGAQRGPNIFSDEFFAKILNRGRRRAGSERFLPRRFQIFFLADVANHGDHFASAVRFFQPRDNDGRIQPARIGKNNFLWQCGIPSA